MSIPKIASYQLPSTEQLPVNRVDWQVDSGRAVLLVHDMQEYFIRFYGEESTLIESMKHNIATLISHAREQGIPIVYTAQPTEQSIEKRALLTDMWGPGLTTENPALQQVVTPLAPQQGDTVLEKWRYSAFQKTPLLSLMETWRRDQLIIVGIYAHIGCMTTALDAFMRDIQPFMVADALADFSEKEHLMALDFVAGRCGSVVTTQSLLNTTTLSRSAFQAQLLTMIDEDESEFDPDENLIDYGLDSIQVMALVAQWKKRGISVEFEELAITPTFNGWWALLQEKAAA